MIVYISGDIVYVVGSSVKVDDRIFERSTADFDVLTDEHVRFSKGQRVTIKDDDNVATLFDGYIEQTSEEWISDEYGSGANLKHAVVCVDHHYLADKRIIARSYINKSAGDIVKDIVNGFLGNAPILGDNLVIVDGVPVQRGEGVTIGQVEQGQIFAEVVFNYISVASALDSMADKCNFWWTIDSNKRIYFAARRALVAPFAITSAGTVSDTAGNSGVKVSNANSQYRNRQYIKGGRDITDPQTEIQAGDGNKRAYALGFPVYAIPTIEVKIGAGAYTAQTVGFGGIDDASHSKQWYWNKNERVIFQDQNLTPLTSSDRIRVTYQGLFDMVLISYSQGEVVLRQIAEGGDTSGYVEDVADYTNILGRANAFQTAAGLLQTYGVIGRTVTFETLKDGLKPGQLITVNFPEHDLSGDEFLIESVETVDY